MPTQIKRTNVTDAAKSLKNNASVIMIDVREDDEVREVASTLAKAFPMSKINPATFAADCGVRKDQALFLLCKSGGRSMRVATALADAGFTDLTNVDGGIMAWEAAGLPVKRG